MKSSVLKRIEDQGGTRMLSASLTPAGEVRLEGVDYGDGVEAFYGEGNREYEYIMSIKAEDVPTLLAALGGGEDIITALHDYFSRQVSIAPGAFLDAHQVPYTFWSRTGD
jgi:hypothetical protein